MKQKKTMFGVSLLVVLFVVASLTLSPMGSVSKASASPTFGNATVGDILSGKTGTTDAGQITGTMPNKTGAGVILTPGVTDQAFPQGYYPGGLGDGKVAGVAVPVANVLSGTTIAGQAGMMPNNGTVVLTPSGTGTVSIPAGYNNGLGYVSQVSVPAGNVLTGTTIAGVAGTMPNQGSPTFNPSNVAQYLSPGYYSGGTINPMSLVAGDYLFASNDTQRSNVSCTPLKVKEFQIGIGGTVRVKFDLASSDSSVSSEAYFAINDTYPGSFVYQGGTSFRTFSKDLSVKAGDSIQVYLWTSNSGVPAYVKNFRLYAALPYPNVSVTLS